MAIMIPEKPRDFVPSSHEDIVFEALSSLPDDYYVFHSLRLTYTGCEGFHENEIDFVIFNRSKGIICLEVKAGNVRYENGLWLYGSGIKMSHGGPFNQASTNKHRLLDYIEKSSMPSIANKCKFLHAVWFVSITSNQLNSISFPPEADKQIVLTKEALLDPEPYIDRIYSIMIPSISKTDISELEAQQFIRKIMCPRFNVFPSASFETDLKKIVFHRLLKEQSAILDFLDDQRTAAINGAAGTGKTMIAVEKAQRHANAGEKVLFLCYNNRLKEFLTDNYSNDNISFYTVDGFVCSLCNSSKPDYRKAKSILEDLYISGSFPYKHIIIDEGQDLGRDSIEETDIVNLLMEIISDNAIAGSFYVFYDKYQLIQSDRFPRFIDDMDCRLTLHKNCRNTENIAITSMKPITEKSPKLMDGSVKGVPVSMHFYDDTNNLIERLNSTIKSLETDGYKDLVILTCKTEETSLISDLVEDNKYMNKYLFTSCRKFKGLEADSIILMDVDSDTFISDPLLFYVGASRARFKLDVFTGLSDEDCVTVLTEVLKYPGKIGKPKKTLCSALNAIGSNG